MTVKKYQSKKVFVLKSLSLLCCASLALLPALRVKGDATAEKPVQPTMAANYLREFLGWCRGRNWIQEPSVLTFVDSNGYRHLLGLGLVPEPEGADENEVCALRMQAELSARGALFQAREKVRAEAAAGVKPSFGPVTHWLYLDWKKPDDGKNYLVVVVGEASARLAVR